MKDVAIKDVLVKVQDAVHVERVYGNPYEKDGAMIIPAASVRGGGAGGGGLDAEGASGEGVGFGVSARPVGAFVFKDGEATWKPAIDVTRIVVVCGLVAIAYFFFRWRIEKARAKEAWRSGQALDPEQPNDGEPATAT